MTFTFNGIKEELKTRLSLLSDWSSTIYFGVYDRILDVIAYITEKLVYLAEWYYTEANWSTATRLDSLMQKVKWLQYSPSRKIGAEGNIILSGDPIFSIAYYFTGETVVIPRWTAFSNSDGDTFVYSTERKLYSKNYLGNITIPVKEGTVEEYIHVAAGDSSEEIILYLNNIDEDEIIVDIVNASNVSTTSVSICGVDESTGEIILINDLDNYYCQIDNAYDFQSVKITFGDGVRNKKLDTGDRVLIKYGKTNGADGNITNASVITKLVSPLYNTLGVEATLYMENEEEISDGADVEDIDDIRVNASQLFQSGYRAGSINDWTAILDALSYIHKSKVWTAYDNGDETATNANKIYICAVTSDGSDLTTSQKAQVVTDLTEFKSPTEIPSFEDLETVYVMFTVEAEITNNTKSEMDDILYTQLDTYYGVLNVDFQENIYESNYIRAIDELTDVYFHTTSVAYVEKLLESTETDHDLSACYQASADEDDISLTSGSVNLWLYRKISDEWFASGVIKIAETVGTELLGLAGSDGITYQISGSIIDFTAGRVTFEVATIIQNPTTYGVNNPSETDTDGYILSVSYTTADGNGDSANDIRLGSQTNITDIDRNFIFTTYAYRD